MYKEYEVKVTKQALKQMKKLLIIFHLILWRRKQRKSLWIK